MARLMLALAVAATGCCAPSTILLGLEASPPTSPSPAGPSPAAWGQPTATLPSPTPTVSPHVKRGARAISGLATYWSARGAAAGPLLRRLLGPGYLGDRIRVWVDGRGPILLRITTSCACGDRPGGHTVVDLPLWAILKLKLSPGQGVYTVKVQEVP